MTHSRPQDDAGSAFAGDQRQLVTRPEHKGERLDRILARTWPDLSRTRLKGLVLNGDVSVGGRTVDDPGLRLSGAETIVVHIPPVLPAEPEGEPIALSILFEDEDLIVLDKPAGLVVHPAPGHEGGTLVNALIAHCGVSLSGIGGVARPGIVHRLDKDTTGLLVVAKNDLAHRGLAAQFADHGRTGPLQRVYRAVAWGVPERRRGTIDASIDRSNRHRDRMAVVARGKGREAITHYAVDETFGPAAGPVASLVSCALETGRTHQIRVHLAHIGHPLLGDSVYGAGFRTKLSLLPEAVRDVAHNVPRQALHAAVLGFTHPISGEHLYFESKLPQDLQELVGSLRKWAE